MSQPAETGSSATSSEVQMQDKSMRASTPPRADDTVISPAVSPADPVPTSPTAPGPPLLADDHNGESGQVSAVASGSGQNVRVFNPVEAGPSATTPFVDRAEPPAELDEAFFEPTLSDVQAHHASVVSRSKRLNEAPLLTSKYRDEEKEAREKRKADKWPDTTIRVKFSDGTQVQSVFPSFSAIQPVYAFVRSCFDPSASGKAFTLWQPPRYTYPEHPPPLPAGKKPMPSHKLNRGPQIVTAPNYGPVRGAAMAGLTGGTGGKETLAELGLVPQSVLLVKWEDESMNATGYPAPLLPELRQKAEPLPSPSEQKQAGQGNGGTGSVASAADAPKEKKIPKWLQKGLMKKK